METQLETLRIQATKAVSNEEREAIREEIRFEI